MIPNVGLPTGLQIGLACSSEAPSLTLTEDMQDTEVLCAHSRLASHHNARSPRLQTGTLIVGEASSYSAAIWSACTMRAMM